VNEIEAEARIDHALIARALGNDQDAFGELVRRHQGRVRAQLRSLMRGDLAAADDVAQETFLTAWRKLHQFRGDARFSTWLYRIAYSRFLKTLPRRDAAAEEHVDGDLRAHLTPTRAVELQLDIECAMQALSPHERIVLMHCVQLGLSHEEAAYALAMPLGTVKTHATRGKVKLRALLADWQDGAEDRRTS
jgi:RNA polymerase sigma-70 factor (ECF subfamily)